MRHYFINSPISSHLLGSSFRPFKNWKSKVIVYQIFVWVLSRCKTEQQVWMTSSPPPSPKGHLCILIPDKLDKLCCFTNSIAQVVLLRLKCSSISFFFFFSPQVHCGGTLRADSGEIQTPNFPFHYPRRTDCQWKIVVSGSSITLNFEEFEVQWDVQMMLRRSALQIVYSAWKQQSLHHVTHQILPLLITLNYR